jgi:hypothetical protein
VTVKKKRSAETEQLIVGDRREGERRRMSRAQYRKRHATEAANLRISGVHNRDRVRPLIGARCGKASRRDLCGGTGRPVSLPRQPHLNQQFVIPPEANAAFVANMEDVLEVYHQPRDPECPLVWLDETSKQLVTETRVPIPAEPGRVARYDYEYERNGTANLFMLFAPLEGWRHASR